MISQTMTIIWHSCWRRQSSTYVTPVKRYVPPTAEEMRSYQEIARGIVSAYSNGQMSVLRELSERFLESACHLRYGDSSKAISPVSRTWSSEHRTDKPLEEFATPDAFEHAMRMRLALTVIYGNFLIASKMVDNALIELDVYTLLQLQEYESKFRREGKAGRQRQAEQPLSQNQWFHCFSTPSSMILQ